MNSLRRFLTLYKTYVLTGGLVCVAILLVVYVALPSIGTIQDRLQTVDTLHHDIAILKTKQGIIDSIPDADLEGATNGMIVALPTVPTFPSIMTSVERLTNDTRVALEMLTIEGGTIQASESAQKMTLDRRSGMPSYDFQMTVTGQIQQIRALLEQLQSVRRIYRIQTFDLALANTHSASDSAVARSTINLIAFYSPAPTTFGKVLDPIEALSRGDQDLIGKVMAFPDMTSSGQTEPIDTSSPQPLRSDPFQL